MVEIGSVVEFKHSKLNIFVRFVLIMFKKQYPLFLILIVGFLILESCNKTFYSNRMFNTDDYALLYNKSKELQDAYLIKKGDEITLKVYSRNGMNLVDVLNNGGSSTTSMSQQVLYIVDKEGYADFPVLGKIYVEGLKEDSLKLTLESEFGKLINQPFVYVRVENRRAIVFMGSKGNLVPLNRYPTNLFEVLAKAGGLDRDLKAYNIKVIRGSLKNPEIREINLSSIQGIKEADLIIQTNDIVYVEQRKKFVSTALQEILTPLTLLVSTITSSLTVLLLLKN